MYTAVVTLFSVLLSYDSPTAPPASWRGTRLLGASPVSSCSPSSCSPTSQLGLCVFFVGACFTRFWCASASAPSWRVGGEARNTKICDGRTRREMRPQANFHPFAGSFEIRILATRGQGGEGPEGPPVKSEMDTTRYTVTPSRPFLTSSRRGGRGGTGRPSEMGTNTYFCPPLGHSVRGGAAAR